LAVLSPRKEKKKRLAKVSTNWNIRDSKQKLTQDHVANKQFKKWGEKETTQRNNAGMNL